MPLASSGEGTECGVRMLGGPFEVHRLRDDPGEVERDSRRVARVIGVGERFGEQALGLDRVLLWRVELPEETQRLSRLGALAWFGQNLLQKRLRPITVARMHVELSRTQSTICAQHRPDHAG